MSVVHILTEILNSPLMITPAKLQTIMSILDGRSERPLNLDLSMLSYMNSPHGGEAEARARPIKQAPEYEEAQIGIVGIGGSLINRHHGFDGGSGLRSYAGIKDDITDCLNDSSIGGILLDINSYGGMSAGCERISRFVREASQVKPIFAAVDLNCYSAAYSIACAADRVILTDGTAGVGSVGCIAIHCDYSGFLEKEGLSYTVVVFGKHKDEMSPYRPLSKDELGMLQRSVDGHGLRFARTVAEFRDLEVGQVLATEARCFTGQEAIDTGLADEIAGFEDAVAMLAAEIKERKRTTSGGFSMTTRERMAGLLAADDGPEAIAELGYVRRDALKAEGFLSADEAKKQNDEAAASVRQQDVQVLQLCQLAGAPIDQAAGMIKEALSIEQVQENLQQQRANSARKSAITSSITPATKDGKHELIAACESMKK